ncbi:hypothetical protein GCM10023231_00230 [Olivibacter ginsenosidimutans]|uniref:Uncharacterized protein n=2 Tax=Olivibacter ginsenosidimutans TaxID=1176537 RepID=A0ABP9ABF4_9SPHI
MLTACVNWHRHSLSYALQKMVHRYYDHKGWTYTNLLFKSYRFKAENVVVCLNQLVKLVDAWRSDLVELPRNKRFHTDSRMKNLTTDGTLIMQRIKAALTATYAQAVTDHHDGLQLALVDLPLVGKLTLFCGISYQVSPTNKASLPEKATGIGDVLFAVYARETDADVKEEDGLAQQLAFTGLEITDINHQLVAMRERQATYLALMRQKEGVSVNAKKQEFDMVIQFVRKSLNDLSALYRSYKQVEELLEQLCGRLNFSDFGIPEPPDVLSLSVADLFDASDEPLAKRFIAMRMHGIG